MGYGRTVFWFRLMDEGSSRLFRDGDDRVSAVCEKDGNLEVGGDGEGSCGTNTYTIEV